MGWGFSNVIIIIIIIIIIITSYHYCDKVMEYGAFGRLGGKR